MRYVMFTRMLRIAGFPTIALAALLVSAPPFAPAALAGDGKSKPESKMSASSSHKAGFREGYRAGFRDGNSDATQEHKKYGTFHKKKGDLAYEEGFAKGYARGYEAGREAFARRHE
jgi:hypothetical protein